MAFLNESDKQRLSETIEAVEEKTSGELVTAIASVSDGYRYIPILFAAVLALLVFPVAHYGQIVLSLHKLMILQLAIFMVFSMLFQLPLIRRFIVPGKVQRQRARRLAYETFYKAGVHHATHRAGILIFVSIEEQYVQIIADEGVSSKVDNSTWDNAINDFAAKVKNGMIAEGFIACINQCGEVLAREFPPVEGQATNQLVNRLIELDGEDL